MPIETLKIQISDTIEPVPAEDWDRLVGPQGTPFMEYAWLRAMEVAQCVEPDVGWMPQIVTAWATTDGDDSSDRLVGAVPLYLKGNSRGEFVYDWAWADLARRVGVQYYPKLIAAVPFSPVSGARLLTDPGLDDEERDTVLRTLIRVSVQLAQELGVSGMHFLFVTPEHAAVLKDEGLMIRNHYQYHWRNENYRSLDDFLARFKAKKRGKLKGDPRLVHVAYFPFEFA
ncbi:MAG: peptidogalycan biosysnthesis protein, partial [Myxococcota bacterium]